MFELPLLLGRENAMNILILLVRWENFASFQITFHGAVSRDGQVVVVRKLWQLLLITKSPGKMMVMRNVDHMVRVDGSKRCKGISNEGKKGDKHVVNDIDIVRPASATADPACQMSVTVSRIYCKRAMYSPMRNSTQTRPNTVTRVAYIVTKRPRAIASQSSR